MIPSLKEDWRMIAPYITSPMAASIAIVPAFYDMIAKSAIQRELQPPSMNATNLIQGIKSGIKAAPTVGTMVGAQMGLLVLAKHVLTTAFPYFAEDAHRAKMWLELTGSLTVGVISSPVLAIYNGKTMMPPWSIKESLSKFSLKQAGAITLQETGFIAGLATGKLIAVPLKQLCGDYKAVEYIAAAIAGALGSLAGHAGNTTLTRLQACMPITNLRQLSLGALRKARGNTIFTVVYKYITETLNAL